MTRIHVDPQLSGQNVKKILTYMHVHRVIAINLQISQSNTWEIFKIQF